MSNRPPESSEDEVIHRGKSCSCHWEGTVPWFLQVGCPHALSSRSKAGLCRRLCCPGKAKLQVQDTRCFFRDIRGRTWVCSCLRELGIPLGKRCHSSLCGPCPLMVKSILPSQPACPETERLSRSGENAGCEGSEADTCMQTRVMSLG